MITKIKIQNFQSHKNTELELSEGINVITGTSNHGKSAILKALYKTINNRPQGSAFLSHFMKPKESMKIEIETPEGKVIREKGKDFDGYIINGEKFEALRTNVPEQATNILNMLPVNIQNQREQFFLLDKSPGEIGKYFNKVVGLEDMNTVLKKSNDDVRAINILLKNKKKDIQEIKEKIQEIKWIESAKENFNKIKQNKDRKKEIQNKKDTLQDIINQYNTLSLKISKINVSGLENCYNFSDWIQNQQKDIEKLIKTKISLKTLTERYQESVFKLNEYKYITQCENASNTLKKALQDVQEIKDKKKELFTLISAFKRVQKGLEEINIQDRQKTINDFLKSVGVCPLCGNQLKEAI